MLSARDGIAARMVTAFLAFVTALYHRGTMTDAGTPDDRHRDSGNTIADYVYTVHVAEGHPVGAVPDAESVRVTGYAPEEFQARPELWIEIICDKDRQAVRERLFRSLPGNNLESLEYRILHKDGSTRWVRNTFVRRVDGQGKLLSYSGLLQDITQHKLAEVETGSLKQRIECILGATKTGLDIVDSDFHIRYVDPEWQKRYGDPTGRKCYEYYMNRREACPDCGVKKALETKAITVTEGVLVNEDDRPVQVTTIPFQNDEGEWLVAEVNVDITARQRAEEALRHSEQRLTLALQAGQGGAWDWDLASGVAWWSAEMYDLWGVEPGTRMETENSFALIDVRDRDCVRRTIADCIANHSNAQCEFRIQHRTRGPRWMATRARTIYNDTGRAVRMLGITVDVTEPKRSEEAIKLAYQKLEGAHRDLQQMQSRVVQQEKLASIGQLAAGVAHEMNTPVGFVASNFETLEEYVKKIRGLLAGYEELVRELQTRGDPDLRRLVEGLDRLRDEVRIDFILEDLPALFDDSREGLERVTSIVQNLRDFSRVDQPGSRDEYDLNKGVEATLVVARNEIKYDADVRTELSELPPVFCHSGQINQVLLNILVNAAQAIRSQGRGDKGTITIRTYCGEGEVVCEIADDGPGIAPENLSRIFDPFFTTKPPGKGTGLGLSVSYDIVVRKHQGKLLVDSTVGAGTKFTIRLPLGTKEDDEQETTSDGKENRVVCGR